MGPDINSHGSMIRLKEDAPNSGMADVMETRTISPAKKSVRTFVLSQSNREDVICPRSRAPKDVISWSPDIGMTTRQDSVLHFGGEDVWAMRIISNLGKLAKLSVLESARLKSLRRLNNPLHHLTHINNRRFNLYPLNINLELA